MAQEHLFMQSHMDGIRYHCLSERILIFQLINLIVNYIYIDWLFGIPALYLDIYILLLLNIYA